MSHKKQNPSITNNDFINFTAEWLFEQGKTWIKDSSIRNVDRTALIFVELLENLNKQELADKLYNYYIGSS